MSSIVENVDVAAPYESGIIRIYKLENADVDEIATTVKELIEPSEDDKTSTEKAKYSDKNSSSSSESTGEGFTRTGEFVNQIEPRVSVSKSTNSIIVQATTRQHRELEKLIEKLDSRKDQVLIKAMIVEVTTTDDLDVGVELSYAGVEALAFTSFGLSTGLNPLTGTRDITVSPGGTGAVIDTDTVQGILHLIKTDANIRVVSEPQILVNDHAIGVINSIAEEPTTQVNQGETTTTTSFAGFVEAGTQFAITPHISTDGYLRIEYEIILNSFTATSTDPSIPPPRSTTSIRSEATVPDGYTIVVGGLQATSESETIDKVPLLGDIPIIGEVFKSTQIDKQYKTTYLFITPIIMKSDDFADLRDYSNQALEEIEVSDDEESVSGLSEDSGD